MDYIEGTFWALVFAFILGEWARTRFHLVTLRGLLIAAAICIVLTMFARVIIEEVQVNRIKLQTEQLLRVPVQRDEWGRRI